MAFQITLSGSYTLDESTGLQTPLTTDTGNDVSVTTLPTTFSSRLTALGLSLDPVTSFPGKVGVAASGSNLATVGGGGSISELKLTDTGGGTLNGDESGLFTLDGNKILLYTDSSNPNILLGREQGSNDIIFAVYMDVTFSGTTSATIKFWTVTFEPLQHNLNGLDSDDAVDLLQNVRLSAVAGTIFNFDGTPSGKNLFTGIQSGTDAIIVTPDTEVLELNTSKAGGRPTSIAIGSQNIDPGEKVVITFVTDPAPQAVVPNLTPGSADLETNIVFGGLKTVPGSTIIINQVVSGAAPAFDLAAWKALGTTETTGDGFINGYADDTVAAITSVTVKNATGGTVGTWTSANSGTTISGVKVTFLTGANAGKVNVSGFDTLYSITYVASGHERISVTGTAGKFDIGGIGIESSTPTSTSLAGHVFVDDDGPTASIVLNPGVKVVHDETPGVQNLNSPDNTIPATDNDDNDQPLNTLPIFFGSANIGTAAIGWARNDNVIVNTSGSSVGNDTPGTVALSLVLSAAGAASGLKDLATERGISLYYYTDGTDAQGLVVGRVNADNGTPLGIASSTGAIAFAIKLESDGHVSTAQYRYLFNSDPNSLDEQDNINSNVLFAKVTATDKDNDSKTMQVDLGPRIGFEDDGPAPAAVANPDTIQEDDLTFANSGGQSVGYNEPGDSSVGKQKSETELSTQIATGVDQPVSYNLKSLTQAQLDAALPKLLSKGDAVSYTLALNIVDADPAYNGADKVTATAGGRTVFEFWLQTDGTVVFQLKDQLDHVAGGGENTVLRLVGGGTVNSIDFASLLDVKDKDLDAVTVPAGAVDYVVQDDAPAIGPVANSIVDFAAGSAATKSLGGIIGADEKANPYTITAYTAGYTIEGTNITLKTSATSTSVTYYQDSNGNNLVDTGEAFYTLTLNQTANSGAGSYTFTVLKEPPPVELAVDFNAIKSGGPQEILSPPLTGSSTLKGIFDGLLFTGATNLASWSPNLSTLAQAQDPRADNDGTNIQDLTGSGSPDANDDGNPDSIGFGIKQGQASQFNQNEGFMAAVLDTKGTATTADDELVEMSKLAFDIQGIGNIKTVIIDYKIVDEGVVVYSNTVTVNDLPSGNKSVPFEITRMDAGHNGDSFDAVYVRTSYPGSPTNEGVRLINFRIGEPQPTPDQKLDFTVQVADFDGDTTTSDFSIGIDGTGSFHDGMVAGV